MEKERWDDPGKRVWIAEAPNGVPSSGPVVIYDLTCIGDYPPEETLNAYKEMGYSIKEARFV